MSSFTLPLTVTKISGRLWKVERSFTYHIGSESSPETVKVPKNFSTDFASVPRIFWIIIPPDGQYSQSAVMHDYTYFKKLFTRKKCDKVFYESMGVLGVSQWKRWVMWKCVRIGAWYGWRLHRRRNND